LNLAPLYELRLRTPRLELRLGNREELAALARLAQEGIHPPEEMPFAVAWTDRIGEADFVESFVEFHEAALRDWRPEKWSLNLLVFVEALPAGSQTIAAEDFASTRTVGTGSWLGKRFQRQGLGTEMRAAVLELAFRKLGAEAATSGAIVGNEASKRVSEKLGYTTTGTSTVSPRGEPLTHLDLRIEREAWASPVPVEIADLEGCLALFGLTAAFSKRRRSTGAS
jgi:RimJ/RimL family protein N-acetyltransferase